MERALGAARGGAHWIRSLVVVPPLMLRFLVFLLLLLVLAQLLEGLQDLIALEVPLRLLEVHRALVGLQTLHAGGAVENCILVFLVFVHSTDFAL